MKETINLGNSHITRLALAEIVYRKGVRSGMTVAEADEKYKAFCDAYDKAESVFGFDKLEAILKSNVYTDCITRNI